MYSRSVALVLRHALCWHRIRCLVCLSSLFLLRSACVDFAADLAKQWRKNSWGGFEVCKNDFRVYFLFWCVFLFVLIYSFPAVQRHEQPGPGSRPTPQHNLRHNTAPRGIPQHKTPEHGSGPDDHRPPRSSAEESRTAHTNARQQNTTPQQNRTQFINASDSGTQERPGAARHHRQRAATKRGTAPENTAHRDCTEPPKKAEQAILQDRNESTHQTSAATSTTQTRGHGTARQHTHHKADHNTRECTTRQETETQKK